MGVTKRADGFISRVMMMMMMVVMMVVTVVMVVMMMIEEARLTGVGVSIR